MWNSPAASRVALRNGLNKHFSLGDLDDLCFRIGVDREMITSGENDNKDTRVRRIIIFFQERGELERLLQACDQARPGVEPWREFANAAPERLPDPVAIRRRRLGLAAAGLIGLGAITAFALELPPFPKRIKADQRIGTIPVAGAHRLSRTNAGLLVSTQTDGPCPSNDTGLFALAVSETEWRPLRVPLRYSASGCAAITSLVHEPSSGRVYAATSQSGLLRSDDPFDELSWMRVGTDSLPSNLDLVAVQPENAGVVFVSGRTDGLFRSSDGGNVWKRLDQAAASETSCREVGTTSLKGPVRIAAMAVTARATYIATGPDDDFPGKQDGVYVSYDSGECWQGLISAEQRFVYRALAAIPGDTHNILVLTYDKEAAGPFAQASQLWRVRVAPAANNGDAAVELYRFKPTTRALYVTPETPMIWYVATEAGDVIRGTVAGTEVQVLPMVLECLLPGDACMNAMAFATDEVPGMPLLLAAGQVFRLKQ